MMKRALTLVLACGFALGWGSRPADAAAGLTLQPVATGLYYATSITNAGDGSGRLFVTTQRGRILIVDSSGLRPTPFLDISALTSYTTEQGLLGLAFHKNYATNHYFYVDYTDTTGKVVVARYTTSAGDPNVADPASATILMTMYHPYANHNGGQLQFGPDGFLYIGSGDGGSEGDPYNLGQNLNTWLGKILRIDVDGGFPYAIPPSNPFHYPNAPEIWAYGLRNPWRFSFDRVTGDLLIADVGQYTNEEIDFQPAASTGGQNYGWRVMEGDDCYDPVSQDAHPGTCPNGGMTPPVMSYAHGDAYCAAVTGGYRYRGAATPSLAGTYLFGDFCSGRIWASQRDAAGAWAFAPAVDTASWISTFGEDEAGELYIASYYDGKIYKIAAGGPALSINDVKVAEGDTGTTDALFRVFLLPASSMPVTVDYATLDGTATAGLDYTPTSGTLTFSPGATSATIVAPVIGDRLFERDETFRVALSSPLNASVTAAGGVGTATIVNDDTGLSIADATVVEGYGLGDMTFTVTASPVPNVTTTVDFTTQDEGALAGSDYQQTTGTLTFPPGVATRTLNVPIIGDILVEPNETFVVALSNPVNATIVRGSARGTIVNDDTGPQVFVDDASVAEGDSGAITAVFNVTLSWPSAQPITVDYTTEDSGAQAGVDYVSATGALTFDPGVVSLSVPVTVLGDTLSEPNEQFRLRLYFPVFATLGRGVGIGTIVDDDPLPIVSVADATVVEGDSGTRDMVFPVTLSAPSGGYVVLTPTTSPVTATESVITTFSGSDSIDLSMKGPARPYPSTIVVPPLSGPVRKVTVSLDFEGSGPKSADVLLVGPRGQKVLLVSDLSCVNSRPFAVLSMDDEGAAIPQFCSLGYSGTFRPTDYDPPGDTDAFASPAPARPYSNALSVFKGVDPAGAWSLYAMGDPAGSVGSLWWSLTLQTEGDYVRASQSFSIPPGATNGVITVSVIGDQLVESDETFNLDLGPPGGAVIGNGHAVGTILNDDTYPEISIGDATIAEASTGLRRVDFEVTLSKPGYLPAIFDYTTEDGAATSASGDYVPAAGTFTIAPGATTGHITVWVRGDLAVEGNETFSVALSSPVHATLADALGVATITNDDLPGHFQFSAPVYNVGEGAGSATVVVRRLGGVGGGATVDYSAVDGTAIGAAGSNQDYQPTSGTLTFAAGQTALAFKVPIVRDRIHEGTESVLLHLRNPQPSAEGAILGTPSLAVMNILDDDPAGRIRLSSATYTVAEGAGSINIAVVRVGGNATPVTVHYGTSPGTATGGGIDYGDASGDLTFASSGLGAIVQIITIPIAQDEVAEGVEKFDVTLSSPSGGATLASPSVATVTIIDDERTVEFSASTYSAKESQRSALVTLRRSGPLDGVATVDYATGDLADTATPGADYKPTAGTVTFPPFVSTRYLAIPIMPDALVEGPETVTLSLGHPTGLALGETNRAVLTILDDDTAPVVEFAASAYVVNEAAPSVLILVKRTGTLADAVLVDYAAAGGSATNAPDPAADYDLAPGTLTFGKGIAIRSIAIPIVRDTLDEGTETVELSLSNPRNIDDPGHVSLGPTSQTTVRIIDNEPTVQFAAAAYTVGEAARSLSIPVFRTGLGQAGSVVYDIVGGSAVRDTGSGGDYAIQAPGTLTFGPTEWYKTLSIVLDPDTVADGAKTIALALSAPSGAHLGSPATTLITIRDDDTAGRVQFAAASVAVSESGTAATITVTRTGGTSSEASVRYTIAAGATANPAGPGDFDAGSGTLTFGAHELSKTFLVPVHDNLVPDSGAVSVDLVLDAPGGGLALGPQSVATLWIVRE